MWDKKKRKEIEKKRKEKTKEKKITQERTEKNRKEKKFNNFEERKRGKKFNPTKSLVSWIALNTIFLSCVSVTFSLLGKVNGFNEQIPRLDLSQ